jgi:hypothetical protein
MSKDLLHRLEYIARVFRDYDEFAPNDIELAGTLPDEAAARIRELEAQCFRLTEERDRAIEWRDHDKTRAEAAEAEAARLREGKPGEIERAVWSAMIWAAANNPGFDGCPEYTDRGNSFAEDEARRAANRIRAALTAPSAKPEE